MEEVPEVVGGGARPPDTRTRILIAACEMLGEDSAASLSVRAVAARAGVSMGSLRHHFPTQRALHDAVIETIYSVVTSDEEIIHDRSLPARDRLVRCLRQILAPEVGEPARQAWIKVFDAYIVSEPTAEARRTYKAMTHEGDRHVGHWLAVLAQEGALREEDIAKQVHFLGAVVTGLSIARALPVDESALLQETETLYVAVDAILDSAG